MGTVYQVVKTTVRKEYHAVEASNEGEATQLLNQHTLEFVVNDTNLDATEMYETSDPQVTKVNGL